MRVNKNRLVETASALIDVHSFTGDEQRMADCVLPLIRTAGASDSGKAVSEHGTEQTFTGRGAAAAATA